MKHEYNTDDAMMSRLMDESAEELGAQLWQEYQQAQASGQVPPIPEELDRKCRQQINREYHRQYAETLGKPLLKWAGRAAAAVIAGAWFDGGSRQGEDEQSLAALLEENPTKE